MQMNLAGKTAVITGAAQGLGEAFARRILKNKGNVSGFDALSHLNAQNLLIGIKSFSYVTVWLKF